MTLRTIVLDDDLLALVTDLVRGEVPFLEGFGGEGGRDTARRLREAATCLAMATGESNVSHHTCHARVPTPTIATYDEVAGCGISVRYLPPAARVHPADVYHVSSDGCEQVWVCTGDELENFAERLALMLAANDDVEGF